MPARKSSGITSVWNTIDAGLSRPPCPGCKGSFSRWTRVEFDGVEVLTHDGDTICPKDPTFGFLTGPELVAVGSGVAA